MSGIATQRDVDGFKNAERVAGDVEQAVKDMTAGGTYEVRGDKGQKKQIATAAGVNSQFVKMANADLGRSVGVRIISVGKDQNQAWGHVCAYVGSDPEKPLISAECKVVLDFETMRQKFIWDAIDKGVWLWDQEQQRSIKWNVEFEIVKDAPVPLDPRIQVHLIRLFLQKKQFAERDAETHARERAQRQVLAMEWREKEEQDQEKGEMDDVAEMRQRERGESGNPPSIDDIIPENAFLAPLCGISWRKAAANAPGRVQLQRIAEKAKVQKFADAARAALAWAEAEMAKQPPTAAAPPAEPEQRKTRSRASKPAEAPPPAQTPTTGAPTSPPPTGAPSQTSSGSSTPGSTTPSSLTASPASSIPSNGASAAPSGAPAGASDAAPPATPVHDPAKAAKAMYSIIGTVSKWPGVDTDKQIAEYEVALAAKRGMPEGSRLPISEALSHELDVMLTHLNRINDVWKLAVSKYGEFPKALSELNDLAKADGYEGYFDPWLGKASCEAIRDKITASPISSTSPSA